MKHILTVRHITKFMLFCMFLLLSSSSFAVKVLNPCISPQVQCCPSGVKSCCDPLSGGLQYDISCYTDSLIEDPIIVDPIIDTECTSGQKKYQISGCSQQTNTCSSCGTWCGWGVSCPSSSSCTSSQCWKSSTCSCESKGSTSRTCSGNVSNASSGTQTRTATCSSGAGWSYGSWTGTCTCKSGYTWTGSYCKSNSSSGYTWSCSYGTLTGSAISCLVMTTSPYWPSGRSCSTKNQYCQGSYNPNGGNLVVGDSSELVKFYCVCN